MDLKDAIKIVELWYKANDFPFTDKVVLEIQRAWVQQPSEALAKLELYKELLRIRFKIYI